MKRKVLIVVHQLNHGGVQRALLTALKALDYEKNEVTLYVRKNRTQFLKEVDERVSKIIVNEDNTHYYRKPYSVLCLFQMQICKLIKAERKMEQVRKRLTTYILKCQMQNEQMKYFASVDEYDVAVSYIQGYNAQFVAQYIKAKRKVMFYHDSVDQKHELHEIIMPEFDAIVGVNSVVKQMLAEAYPEFANKMIFIDNYVEPKEIMKKAKETEVLHKETEQLILCSCGRFTDVKGFDLAVDAAHYLQEKGISFKWYFVGDGPNRPALERQIQEYGLGHSVILVGMQDNPYPWMYKCHIHVQPSYEEAHPLAILEAFILCKPVVTTKTLGGKKLVQQNTNGIVTDIDGRAIADGIEFLLNRKEVYEKMVHHLEKIDYSNAKEEYQKQWETLLEG